MNYLDKRYCTAVSIGFPSTARDYATKDDDDSTEEAADDDALAADEVVHLQTRLLVEVLGTTTEMVPHHSYGTIDYAATQPRPSQKIQTQQK